MAFTKHVCGDPDGGFVDEQNGVSEVVRRSWHQQSQAFMPTLPDDSVISQFPNGFDFFQPNYKGVNAVQSASLLQVNGSAIHMDKGIISRLSGQLAVGSVKHNASRVKQAAEDQPHVALHLVSQLLEDETITMSDATPPEDDDSVASSDHGLHSPALASSWPGSLGQFSPHTSSSVEADIVFSSSWGLPYAPLDAGEGSSPLGVQTTSPSQNSSLFLPDMRTSPPSQIMFSPPSTGSVSSGTPSSPGSLSPLQGKTTHQWSGMSQTSHQPSSLLLNSTTQQLVDLEQSDKPPSLSRRGHEMRTVVDLPSNGPSECGKSRTGKRRSSANSRSPSIQSLMDQVELVSQQLHTLEAERRQAEQEVSRVCPSRRSSSLPTFRMPPHPTRVDRALVEQLREHAKVELLIGRIERARQTPLPSSVSVAVDRWHVCLREIQSLRRQQHQEHPRRAFTEGDATTLIPLLVDLVTCNCEVRKALWCAVQMSVDDYRARCRGGHSTYSPRGVP